MAARPPGTPGGRPPIEFESQRKVVAEEAERRKKAADDTAENDRLAFETHNAAANAARDAKGGPRIKQKGEDEEKKKADEAAKKSEKDEKPKDSHHSDHHGGLSWERIGRHLADTVGGQEITPIEERFIQRWARKGVEKVAEILRGGKKQPDQAEQFRNAEQGLEDAAKNGGPPGAEGEPILPARGAEALRKAQAEPAARVERPGPGPEDEKPETPEAEKKEAEEPGKRTTPKGGRH